MSQENKKEGLPEIAQLFGQKKSIACLSVAIILSVTGWYWSHRDNQPSVKSTEETYTVATDAPVEIKKTEQPSIFVPKVDTVTPSQPPSEEEVKRQIALIQEKQKALQQRLSAPLMLVNNNQAGSSSAGAEISHQAVARDANTQFMNQVATQNTEVSMAMHLGPLNALIAEGNLIHATMETATNSDLPGYLRASVSEPVYSEDGTKVLIPRASRLIGQYKSGMLQGQSRIFIVWTRLITPDGFSIQLGSPGVDSLGVAGMGADEINRHFWERFGNASLLSLIGAGTANVGVSGQDENNSAANYREAIANSFSQSASESLQQDSRIAPTLKAYQGKPIIVFVARDLNFQHAIKLTQSKLNVF